MTPEEFAKFALDRRRLAVLGRLALTDATTDELAELGGHPRRDVLEWVGALVTGGLVGKGEDGRWQLQDRGLHAIAERLPRPPPPSPRVFFGMTAGESEVLAKYTSGNRLVEIPQRHADLLVVLERLALEFDPGERYPEPHVNGTLSLWHPDHARLRRALVDEGFMDRAGGEYWRTGGRITDLPA